ncbi:MAG: hypothetical protein EZS28_014687 [Streblomastix strix]|uniref:Uncharacterized protein n=1 Tax=Streblomastix strix TaxID=222440 RepID=A0A5J4W4L8_9EUKA|nr:MAG: hypothetical protein EZS28_014687 [Streblomastix strix]
MAISLSEQQFQQIISEEERNARREFEAEKGVGGSGACGQGLMEVDGMVDYYDYYESQAARQDRLKSRAKPFGRLPFHPSMIQRTRKHGGPQFRYEAGKRFSVSEQDLDDNVATSDNVVVFNKKKNAIYSVVGYKTAVGFGDSEHLHKRNWKKQYYSDVNDLERATLAAKLKQQGIKGDPYMKWLSMTKPHKVREIKNFSFRAFTVNAKKVIDQNGGANLPMATKQLIMASVWNSVLIIPAVEILETQDGKIDIYNRSNKANIQKGDYEYLPLAQRLYKNELAAVITQLYQVENIDARIKEALGQAMQYYGQILTNRQQQIGGYDLAKYKFIQNRQ